MSASVAVPRIVERSTTIVSPWVKLVERKVDFGAGRIESYHAIEQADYVGILAVTPDNTIPIVRQYRPALERHTWELPAGMVEAGEDPATTCVRELREETGLIAREVHSLGVHAADSARLGNRIYSFLVQTEVPGAALKPEPGIVVDLINFERLRAMILLGEFDLQYHVGVVCLALLRPEIARLLHQSR